MKFWSLSRLICNNPVTPPALANDLVTWLKTGQAPEHMFSALHHVTNCTAPQFVNGLSFIVGIGSPDRRILLRLPDQSEFEQLERFGLFELADGTLNCHVEALH